MKHNVIRSSLLAALLLVFCTPNSNAVVVYDSFATGETWALTGGETLGSGTLFPTLAYKFTPTSIPLGNMDWEIRAAIGLQDTDPVNLRIGIWNDNGTTPSATGPLMFADIGAPGSPVLSVNMSGATLTSGTAYWITFSYQSGAGVADLHFKDGTTTALSASSAYMIGDVNFPSWNADGSLSEVAYSINAVPEPETYAVAFGLGLIAFAAYRRYSLKRA